MSEVELLGKRTFRNVYCVGRNYKSFADQMGNDLPERPLIFLKPTHSLEKLDGSLMEFDGTKGEVNAEAEIVLHVGVFYEKGISVEDLIDKVTVGLDFTYRDVLNEVKKKGQPWTPAKGFPASSGYSEFRSFTDITTNEFKLKKNGELLQVGHVRKMIFSLQTLVNFIGENFGLGEGDLIYTGTPEGIATLEDGDFLEILSGEEIIGSCKIGLSAEN